MTADRARALRTSRTALRHIAETLREAGEVEIAKRVSAEADLLERLMREEVTTEMAIPAQKEPST